MQPNEALDALKTEEALQPKLSRTQFYSLLTGSVIVPLAILLGMGAWF